MFPWRLTPTGSRSNTVLNSIFGSFAKLSSVTFQLCFFRYVVKANVFPRSQIRALPRLHIHGSPRSPNEMIAQVISCVKDELEALFSPQSLLSSLRTLSAVSCSPSTKPSNQTISFTSSTSSARIHDLESNVEEIEMPYELADDFRCSAHLSYSQDPDTHPKCLSFCQQL
ncbi:hypothetical protein K469DRAFT_688274 [Zopfia rhizophila CBS 207.26]|uniref:Uncharacterized protein n=1 Tax=Zopfia rhizophila CBS 207.26 TaxID=1314779 RepID=A0A6A6E3G9_9PEZI|nr:hypothetical protein K469DRAFT_688274 [Zopfia rhizophila CBS 207.26]